jgi:hypothetical protein
MTEFGSWRRDEGIDTWTTGPGMSGQEAGGPSCSFCGSLHPDRFMELVRDGWIVGPTDKTYKAYLDRPTTEAEKKAARDRWQASVTGQALHRAAVAEGKSPEQVVEELDRVYETEHPTANSAGQVAKFYYQHLSAVQRAEFITLYNEHRMIVGYPGHLYVTPFFAVPNPA